MRTISAATSQVRVFAGPARYVQGPGALNHLGEYVLTRGGAAAVFIDGMLYESLSARILRTLSEADVDATAVACSGEVTVERIAAFADQARSLQPEVVIAVGGGKTLDVGKGVALALDVGVITVPTIASNDGPTSRLIATYDDDHRLVSTPQLPLNPEAVVVDTEIISQAPADYLRSGIGDAVAKRFEAATCRTSSGRTPNGTRPLETAAFIADGCYQTLRRDAVDALSCVERGEISPALERVVEAVILMSGLAFENGGLSLAHSMTRGLMTVDGALRCLHGFHVAYGLLVQLAHEKDPTSYHEVDGFLAKVDLPRSLTDLGAQPEPDVYLQIARATLKAPHMANCVPTPSRSSLVSAMELVESGWS